MSDEFINPEMAAIGLELSYNAGKEIRKIMLDSGITSEEIEKIMKEVRSNIRINGIPLDATICLACDGHGWIHKR